MSTSSNQNQITMVERTFKILDALYTSNSGMGISELSQKLGYPKANVFRILSTLLERKIVERAENRDKFILGLGLISYGEKVKAQHDLVSLCRFELESLGKDIGETLNLTVKYEQQVLNIFHFAGESSVLVSKLFPLSPLHCSSTGKIFLAFSSKEERTSYFEQTFLEKRTINTITDFSIFESECSEIKKSFIAYDHEEYEYGLTCIGSPLFDKNGAVIAAVSISGPTSRLAFKNIDILTQKLLDCKDALNEKIREYSLSANHILP